MPNPPTALFSTTTFNTMLCAKAPLVPLIVTRYAPTGADAAVRTRTVVRPLDGFGSNSTPEPAGRPVAVKVTSGAGDVDPTRGSTLTAATASLPAVVGFAGAGVRVVSVALRVNCGAMVGAVATAVVVGATGRAVTLGRKAACG